MSDSNRVVMEGKWCVDKMMLGEIDCFSTLAAVTGMDVDPRESMYYIFNSDGTLTAKMGTDEAAGTFTLEGDALTLFTDPEETEHGIEAVVDSEFFTISETAGDMVTKMIYKKVE